LDVDAPAERQKSKNAGWLWRWIAKNKKRRAVIKAKTQLFLPRKNSQIRFYWPVSGKATRRGVKWRSGMNSTHDRDSRKKIVDLARTVGHSGGDAGD
jgi:hypothetical protein